MLSYGTSRLSLSRARHAFALTTAIGTEERHNLVVFVIACPSIFLAKFSFDCSGFHAFKGCDWAHPYETFSCMRKAVRQMYSLRCCLPIRLFITSPGHLYFRGKFCWRAKTSLSRVRMQPRVFTSFHFSHRSEATTDGQSCLLCLYHNAFSVYSQRTCRLNIPTSLLQVPRVSLWLVYHMAKSHRCKVNTRM